MSIDIVMLVSIVTLLTIIIMFFYVLNYMRKHIIKDIKSHDEHEHIFKEIPDYKGTSG